MLESLLAVSAVTGVASGIFSASANRQAARANMKAIKSESAWNIGVMKRNKEDVLQQNFLQSYASGIDYSTGSTAEVIENNQEVLQREIDFQKEQYDIAYKTAKAQSKQRYLGIF